MASLSIIDKAQNNSHLHHFVVQTRTFQIEKARNIHMYENLHLYIKRQNEKRKQEMEMSAELKRAKREKEQKTTQDKLTLEQLKLEIEREMLNIAYLKIEKSRLFVEYKQILGDENEKKSLKESHHNLQLMKEAATHFNHLNPSSSVPIASTAANGSITTASTTFTKSNHESPKSVPENVGNSSSSGGGVRVSSSSSVSSNKAQANAATILPSSLHHLQPIQPMFFAQQHNASSYSSTQAGCATQSTHASPAPSPVPVATNHHRLNARVPTPNGPNSSKSGQSQPHQQLPPPSIYSHSSAPLSLTSISLTPSLAQTMQTSSSTSSNDRYRIQQYKRTLEQASAIPVSLPSSTAGLLSVAPPPPNSSQASQLHYLPQNFNLSKPSINQLPPGPFPQLTGQPVIPNLEAAYYQHLFYNMPPGSSPFLNPNANSK